MEGGCPSTAIGCTENFCDYVGGASSTVVPLSYTICNDIKGDLASSNVTLAPIAQRPFSEQSSQE